MEGGKAVGGRTPLSPTKLLRWLVSSQRESGCVMRLRFAGVGGVGSRARCCVWLLAVGVVVGQADFLRLCRSRKVEGVAEALSGVVVQERGPAVVGQAVERVHAPRPQVRAGETVSGERVLVGCRSGHVAVESLVGLCRRTGRGLRCVRPQGALR